MTGIDNVSRETLARLERYAALLHKWNPTINLVSRTSLEGLWNRHILDSVQLFDLASHPVGHWLDIGSGGGFPGLVIALMRAERGSPERVTMIESDQRKATFLRTVLRETEQEGAVLSERIEAASPQRANVISARAVADLSTLLEYAERHLAPDGVCLFPKGVTWEKEVKAARKTWSFTLDERKSQTEPGAVILKIGDLSRV
ncbi:16S rRNA (guanine527-N7)-methyltransferase [Salinihabitans flavidus]|uniref:Ribosomal RNA small subunit methyltransferase G n=1 Tax=Salinihabitans flavidus TaxID=569882 RepID=A0A1H8LZA3_9RHOB|nr:16S rRNA (guanine(527)-N(7))-methyltransferase RsmG [Salinihabitans flavidus]SEO10206.1 16S rRNA (guanine527-N7)-methyltransferase [Salinihabitans flavidus]